MLRYTLALCSMVLLFCALPGPAAAAPPAELTRAQSLIGQHKEKEAVQLLDTYIAQNPKSAQAYVLRGDARDDLGDLTGAMADYAQAIAINPEFEYAYATRCGTEDELGKYEAAIVDCTRAITLDAKDPYSYRLRSYAHSRSGDYDVALTDADKALSLDDTNALNFGARCRALRGLQRYQDALAACDKAVALANADPDLLFQRGIVYALLENWPFVQADMATTLRYDPTFSDAHYWLADANLNLHSFQSALREINKYLHDQPDDADALLLRARIEIKLNDRQSALSDANAALARYKVQNDEDGMKSAQDFLSQLSSTAGL